ncbi:MAG: glycosyltransferase [Planctomycetes bacterium]|nr:glycosyltransferase [Planctomycetota bacterium]
MRLTFVVHQFPPRYFTGTEQYALAVGQELQRRGHDVDVFSLDPAFAERDGPWRESREIVGGLPVRRINYWMWLDRDWARLEYRHPFMAEVFARHLRDRDPDVVHSFHLRHLGADLLDRVREQGRPLCVSLTDFWFLCPRVILMRNDGAPCDGPPADGLGCLPCHAPELARELAASGVEDEILALHQSSRGRSKPGNDLRSRVASHHERWPYLRQRLLAARTIVAPTEYLRSVFVQNGIPAARIAHRGYGIDTAGLQAGAARAGTQDRPLTFGFFGTFAPHKGPHVLVEAFRRVRADCRLLLRGRTTDFPDYSRDLLAAAAQDARIAVQPPFDRAELPAALGSIDVLVVPSTWHENAPFVVLEARAAGLPVLASRFGGLSEVVRDGLDGDLFAAGDVDELTAKLQRLADEPDRLAHYRTAVQPPKSLTTAVDEFESIYAEAAR